MKKEIRAPVVCVLGHVDHGKTTLLDAIRKTNVVAKEAGGITQSIGASVVTVKAGPPDGEASRKITFLDTPGHAAFSKMRSRGAKVADIAILVVDAAHGVKPQTVESLQLIKLAKLPFIVAITKIDLSSANVERVKAQLEKEGVLFEGKGGETPIVPVSAKRGEGISELIETISLVGEVEEVGKGSNSTFEAVVIESSKDKRGIIASLIVRNGSLKVGDNIFAEGVGGKVRALFDDKHTSVKKVQGGEPAQILGFSDVPPVGARVFLGQPTLGSKQKTLKPSGAALGELLLIVKAKDTGSLEALEAAIPSGYKVIFKGVGDVYESDVLAAKASSARIVAYGSGVSSTTLKLAQTEGVKVDKFEIIYEIIEWLSELSKKGEPLVLGKAEIVATFPFNNKKIAGCKVMSGKITAKDNLILMNGEHEVGSVKIISMKKEKEDVANVTAGEEFGVLFEPQLDFSKGDVLVSVGK